MLRIAAGIAAFAALPVLLGQSFTPGPQIATFTSGVDDSQQTYALYLPTTFDSARKYPLVIVLHGEDTTPQISIMRVFGQQSRISDGSLAPWRSFRAHNEDFIVAAPLARGSMGYQGLAEREVYEVVADVKHRLPIDEDRVYLTGASMGGGGVMRLALTRPDVWAAVAPVCAITNRDLEGIAGNALNLPLRLFQGDLDPLVLVESSRQWQRRLLDLGVAADYIEYPAVRHNAWDYSYKDGAIFNWFSQFRRQRFPERVRFTTDSYRYGSAYWVRIDGLTPGMAAAIDARQQGKGDVMVDTRNLDGFTMALDHPVAAVTIDGAPLHLTPANTVSFRKVNGKWQRGALPQTGKRAGAEGPIAQAVGGRHLYVYGTNGASSSEELEYRQKIAENAATWSTSHQQLQLSFRVKPDVAVTAEDVDNNDLVLFGTRETNSLIARFADRLPLALAPGAADYGLLFITPVGKHYVLVNSGLPWWTGFGESGRAADQFEPRPLAELSTFGDYIVFKGSIAHVVAEGRFDGDWRVPADDARKLGSNGPVAVR